MNPETIGVMIVDDSAVVRGLLRNIIESTSDLHVAATAVNGRDAVAQYQQLNQNGQSAIDVIVMDLTMPEMDGIAAMRALKEIDSDVRVIVCSAAGAAGSPAAIDAIANGAADCIAKPTGNAPLSDESEFSRMLVHKIIAISKKRDTTCIDTQKIPLRPVPAGFVRADILAIGSSTGGLQALFDVLSPLQGRLRIPVVITQHMSAGFTGMVADQIAQRTGIPTHLGADGMELSNGNIYIAPDARHMTLLRKNTRIAIKLDNGAPENFCKPAVDPMMRSLTACYNRNILSVILTGMGTDGLAGARQIVENGDNVLIAQDQPSSIVWGMPGAVAQAGLCSFVLPVKKIAEKIITLL